MTKEELLRYEFIEMLIMQVYFRAAPLFVQLYWRERLTPRQREGIWGKEHWALLIWQFGLFTLLPFAWITRRRRGFAEGVLAILLGTVATLGCAAGSEAVHHVFVWAFDVPDEEALPSSPQPREIPAKKGVR